MAHERLRIPQETVLQLEEAAWDEAPGPAHTAGLREGQQRPAAHERRLRLAGDGSAAKGGRVG